MTIEEEDDLAISEQPAWSNSDRLSWLFCGLIGAVVIAVADQSPLMAGVWLLGSVIRAWRFFPDLLGNSREWVMQRPFLVGVAFAWAVIPGPHVGSVFGTLAPVVIDLPMTSFQGGMLGLLVGPMVAAVTGVVVASLVLGGFRIYLAIVGLPWEHVDPTRRDELSGAAIPPLRATTAAATTDMRVPFFTEPTRES